MDCLTDLTRLIAAGIPQDIKKEDLSKSIQNALEALFGERYLKRTAVGLPKSLPSPQPSPGGRGGGRGRG